MHSVKIIGFVMLVFLLFNCPLFAEETELGNRINLLFSPNDEAIQKDSDKNLIEVAEIKSTLQQVTKV